VVVSALPDDTDEYIRLSEAIDRVSELLSTVSEWTLDRLRDEGAIARSVVNGRLREVTIEAKPREDDTNLQSLTLSAIAFVADRADRPPDWVGSMSARAVREQLGRLAGKGQRPSLREVIRALSVLTEHGLLVNLGDDSAVEYWTTPEAWERYERATANAESETGP
jgi:hypothetical protein